MATTAPAVGTTYDHSSCKKGAGNAFERAGNHRRLAKEYAARCYKALAEGNDWAVQMLHGPDANQLEWSKACFWRESPDTFRRALESRFRGEPAFQEETKIATLDGRTIHVLCTFSYPEPLDELEIVLLTLVDITERG